MNRIFHRSEPIAELEGVTKTYGSEVALDGVDLQIRPGRVTAILGPNGAGKTTSIRLMLGLGRPTAGEVRLFGQTPDRPERRTRTGVMLQTAALPSTLRVRELLELFRSYYPEPLDTDEVLHLASLEDTARQAYGTLSGGQRQRLHFGLALCGNPDLLFLDEPTVGLDVESRRLFWEQIRELTDSGRSIVLTTHYLEEADALADRIVLLQNGRICADGTPAEIKGRAANKRIRCVTSLPRADVEGIDGVLHVELDRAALEILTGDAEEVVRELLRRDDNLRDLEVLSAGIEDAFLALTGGARSPDDANLVSHPSTQEIAS